MSRQAQAFLAGEASAWLKRNQSKLPVANDPVIHAIHKATIIPNRVLEIGCADGWRLKIIDELWDCTTRGIDPGAKHSLPTDSIWQGTADDLPFPSDHFDLVIYGWCLYLCDREDLFKIVSEGDRVLTEGGHLVVYDFHSDHPHSRKYKHLRGIKSYKMDHSALWLANPAYSLFSRTIFGSSDEQTSVSILRKNTATGWPMEDKE